MKKIGTIDHRQVEYSLIRNNNGPAIVVFENGLDGKMHLWNKIIPEISREATTFAYNRPGYGSSDPVSTPRDGLHIIDELRLFLKRNGLKPPYVLVGHSFGGLYMQLFARRYPEEVTGLVLVDSTHPNQFKGKGAIDNWPTWLRVAFLRYLSSTAREELGFINTTGDEVLALPSFTGKPVIVLSALRPMEEKSMIPLSPFNALVPFIPAVSIAKAITGQAKRFAASFIIRPIGKLRGHDRSASLKSE